jgi:phosphate transport system ATP-binding protein
MDVSLIRAKVGMVFQKPTPFPMSIYDNIAFGVRLFERLSRVEMDERVEWALKKAALWNEVKDKLNQSGWACRAASSSACASPAALPSSPRCCCSTSPARRWIRSPPARSRSSSTSSRATTPCHRHPQHAAGGALLSDYTAYMYLGDLIEFGPTNELFMKPKKKETEDYITAVSAEEGHT